MPFVGNTIWVDSMKVSPEPGLRLLFIWHLVYDQEKAIIPLLFGKLSL